MHHTNFIIRYNRSSPLAIGQWVLGHWGIEALAHWRIGALAHWRVCALGHTLTRTLTRTQVEMYFLFALTWSVGISVDEDGRKEVDGLPPHTLSHSLRVPPTLARTPTPYP